MLGYQPLILPCFPGEGIWQTSENKFILNFIFYSHVLRNRIRPSRQAHYRICILYCHSGLDPESRVEIITKSACLRVRTQTIELKNKITMSR